MEKAAIIRYSGATCWAFFLACAVLVLLSGGVKAQSDYALRLLPMDRSSEWLSSHFEAAPLYSDSSAVSDALGLLLQKFRSEAYLEASVDTVDCRDSVCLAILHIGPQYEWARLETDLIPDEFLQGTGFRQPLFRDGRFSYLELQQLQEDLLGFAENHGYPFARTWLDSIRLSGAEVSARLRLERGQLILFDSLRIEGDARIASRYLQHYLGLQPGAPYDRSRLLRSRDRLRELPFLRATADPGVVFQDNKAAVTFPLEKKRASRFDFIIGVLPRSDQTGGMLITGDFEAELINSFGLGERIYAQFEQLRPQTQELELAFGYPYVLGLPLGADIDFSLYKRDTTFLNLIFDAGVSYLLEGGNYLKAYWEQRSSILLSIDKDRLQQSQRLPPNLDVRNSSFGLELLYQQLDYRNNPRRGWSAFLRGGAGLKRTLRNNQIEALELGYLYDSLELRSFQYRLQASLASYLPLFSRSTLKLSSSGGFLFSPQPVYQNEQFRIGGNKLLRGFDEEFFFATQYAVGTLEYRLLIGQNSFLYLFGDYGWLLNETSEQRQTLHPYGFGSGITFETKAGMFGVSLAFGAIPENQQAIDFASPKVHFGYLSRF